MLMSLYNLTNISGTQNPVIWLRDFNVMSEGILGPGILCAMYVIAFSVMVSTGEGKNAFHAANFICFTIAIPLWLIGVIHPGFMFGLLVLNGISAVMLLHER